MDDTTQAAIDWLKQAEASSIERLCDWLRIPSISTDPAHSADCARAAAWAADRLREAGLSVEVLPTGNPPGSGRPVVVGHTPGDPGYAGPHVLFYGHYDVQPADPIELWHSDPFDPQIVRDGGHERIVARGACDDKGQVATFLEALRALQATGGGPAGGVKMTVLIEGEEENGSEHLEAFLRENRSRFAECDLCLISDTAMLARGKPAITYGVRGLAYTEVVLHAADQDLHSGLWGGRAPNPINELAKVLAQLWDEHRRVTIPGFYDDVREIEPSERKAWAELGVDAAESLATIGLPPEADIGEAGYTALEREWGRPTCDINGIVGGYIKTGAKTVIPAKASAKVSFRLVADQDPQSMVDAFFAWLDERTPPGCRWEKINHSTGLPSSIRPDDLRLELISAAVKEAAGVGPALIKTGGSIPLAGLLKQSLGMDTYFVGFGLEDDRVHSPNEKFELDCFRLGCKTHVHLMEAFRRSRR